MAQAIERIEREGQMRAARQARIDADPRILRLRSLRSAAPDSGLSLFTHMADGRLGRNARIGRLIRARIETLDGFPNHARSYLREAAMIRRQHWNTVADEAEFVALEFVTDDAAARARRAA